MPQHVAVSVSASLGVVGLILAAIGIYGVTAFAVTRRTREIGIRIALGARRSTVLCLVVGRGASLTARSAASSASHSLPPKAGVIASFLYGVPPIDPLIFAGAPTLFVIVGILACYVPARGALHISAIDALRCE